MRLFVGLELPWEARRRLAMLGGGGIRSGGILSGGIPSGGIPGARWVPMENYHLTLRFIGEVPGFRAEGVDAALAALRAKRFALELAGVGTFAKGEIRHLNRPGTEQAMRLHKPRQLVRGRIVQPRQRHMRRKPPPLRHQPRALQRRLQLARQVIQRRIARHADP